MNRDESARRPDESGCLPADNERIMGANREEVAAALLIRAPPLVTHFGHDQGDPLYSPDYDRTYYGPNPWNLGPPDDKIRVADITAIVAQYGHDCPA